MCGQCGVAGSVTFTAEKAFQRLIIYNSVRGLDSTGAASVKRNPKNGKTEIVVAKEIGHPFNLLGITRKKPEKDFDDVLKDQHRALIGHTRSSTKGEISRENAHPFLFEGELVGTHNGTLCYQTHHKLDGYSKFGTDSQALYAEIADKGIEEVVKNLDNMVAGDAYALSWYDVKKNTMNLLRNKQRPLFYAYADDKKQLWWSSESGHLAAALCDIPHEKGEWIFELPEDMHFSWQIPEQGKQFGKAHVVKREGKKTYTPFVSSSTHQSHLFKKGSVLNNKGGMTSLSHVDGQARDISHETSWYDTNNHCYTKFSQVSFKYMWAWFEDGPWFGTQLELWAALTFDQQVEKVLKYQYPSAVIISPAIRAQVARKRMQDKNVQQVTPPRTDLVLVESREDKDTKDIKDNKDEGEKPTTLQAQMKEKKFKLIVGDFAEDSAKSLKIYSDPNRKVYWNREIKCYTEIKFEGFSQDPPWSTLNVKTCPVYVPYSKLHPNDHAFHYRGKREKRVTFRIGYQRDMLVRPVFEKLMTSGCLNCQRVPEWDNPVQFVNHEDFFCEHCSRDEENVKLIREMSA